MTRLAVCVLFAGGIVSCGSLLAVDGVGYQPDAGGDSSADAVPDSSASTDAPSDDAVSPPDAAPDAPTDAGPPCDLGKDFGAAKLVAGITSNVQDHRPHLSPDELTIYFASLRNYEAGALDEDIFVAHRATRGAQFDLPAPVTDLNAPDDDADPMIAADGTRIFFVSNRPSGVGSYDIWFAARQGGGFAPPQLVANVNSGALDSAPFLAPNGDLWFSSLRGDAGRYDVYRASGAGAGFAAPSLVAELQDPLASQSDPVLSADGATIYFVSERSGSLGGNDIWRATRTAAGGAFGDVTNVTSLNTANNDAPGWLSPDGCRLYFDSDRSGTTHIYVAERAK